jgi:hypothetical protein
MNRRKFVENTFLAGCGVAVFSACKTTDSLTAKFVKNPYDIEKAREFVYYAHSSLEKVKELHTATPNLIYSTVDWGDGDFESALGAASHVGNEEIATYLIENGARINIFTMAMLGMTDHVKGVVEKYPNTINMIGPHGFTLLHHSEIGVSSPELSKYLGDKGLKEKFVKTFKK